MLKQMIAFCSLLCLALTACAKESEIERVALHELLGIPLVDAKIDGKGPFRFILDTGSSGIVFDIDTVRELKIKTGPLRDSQGVTKGSAFTYAVAPEITFSFGNLDFEARNVTAGPFLQNSQMIMGARVHGILGSPIFNRYTIEMDYERGEVVFHDPNSFYYDGSGGILPIIFRQSPAGLPFVNATFESYNGEAVDVELSIDSGGGAVNGVSLGTQGSINSIVGPNAKQIAIINATGVGNNPETTQSHAFLTRVSKLNIGPFEFEAPLVACIRETVPWGIVGAEVLRRFKVIFDYKRDHMILEPNSDYKKSFEEDKSGMFLTAASDDIEIVQVGQVAPGFAADKAGVRVGDRILAIDGKAVSKMTLNGVRKVFMKEAIYDLTVMRGSDEIDITLKTERTL